MNNLLSDYTENGVSTTSFDVEARDTGSNFTKEINSSQNAVNVNTNNGNVNNNNRNNNNYVLAFSALSEFSLLDFYNAYFKCRKRKVYKNDAFEFLKNYNKEVLKLYNEVLNRTYEISPSICFIVIDPKPREIFAAAFRDRVIHHLVIEELKPWFNSYFINTSFSCRDKMGTMAAQFTLLKYITECKNKNMYIGKFDCEAFFININKQILYNELINFLNNYYTGTKQEVLKYLIELIIFDNPLNRCIFRYPKEKWKLLPKNKSLFNSDPNKGLPIGNLTSLWFANFYLTEFDKWAKNQYNLYIRYVDDIVILAERNQCKSFYKDANKFLYNTRDIRLNSNKNYIQHYSKGLSFLGTHIKIGRIHLNNKTIGRLFNKENISVDSLNSYLGMLSKYNSDLYLINIKLFIEYTNLKFKNKYVVYRT